MGGDHGHGHGHGPPYTVPDYKIYKIENAPRLVELRDKLAEKGLKDPWLRNEVWRFDPKVFPEPKTNLRVALTRGLPSGFIIAGIAILITNLMTGKKKEHHEEHH